MPLLYHTIKVNVNRKCKKFRRLGVPILIGFLCCYEFSLNEPTKLFKHKFGLPDRLIIKTHA